VGGDEHSSPVVDVDPWLESLPSAASLWPVDHGRMGGGVAPATAPLAPPPSPWDVPPEAPVLDAEAAAGRRPAHRRRLAAAGVIVLAGMGLGWVLSPGGGPGLVGTRGSALAMGVAGEAAEHVAMSHLGATTVPPTTVPVVTVPPTISPTEALPVSPPPTVLSPATPSVTTPLVAPPTTGRKHGHRGSSAAAPLVSQVPSTVVQIASELIAQLNIQGAGSVHVPNSANNVALLATWMANEGGLWANNPLNTDLGAGQYPHQFSSGGQDTGTPIYPSMHVGVVNAAATLLGNPAYAQIVARLSQGSAPCLSFANAVIHSPWAASHYGYDTSRFCSATPSQAVVPRNHPGGGHHGHHSKG
jgi:hypothetical protein